MDQNEELGWRMRVLNRLSDLRGVLSCAILPEMLSRMYEVAESLESPSPPPIAPEPPPPANRPSSSSARLFTATHSFLQKCPTRSVPFHFQVVVPGASGTASASPQELYEVAVWERCLLQIFNSCGLSGACFEFCSLEKPLLLDVFPVPPAATDALYWRAAFEEMRSDVHDRLLELRSRSQKQVFPPEAAYVAVTFDDGKGIGRIWEGGRD
jgi:hypothetical protein